MFNYAVEATLSEAIIATQSDDDEEQAMIRPVGRHQSSTVENLVSVHGFEAMISWWYWRVFSGRYRTSFQTV